MKKKEYQKRLAKEKRDLKEYNELGAGINYKSFVVISISVIGFVFLMFAFTKIKTGEWNLFTKENSIKYTATIQDVKILCGSVLNRDEEEYFVLAYKLNEDDTSLYETILERYNSASNKLKLYKLDLGNSRNNICMGELNITNDIENLKLTVPTLIKVTNGNITENYTNYEAIKDKLLSYLN